MHLESAVVADVLERILTIYGLLCRKILVKSLGLLRATLQACYNVSRFRVMLLCNVLLIQEVM
ncbi:hypothetical protein BG55_07345 [Erwinia mallotivora]|uniref:Uncharacterized protein n=1 Tax=Erwinia mallotivora TaxID=69222 RepID=A0A014N9U9_9GAMM|nr:hypothetical protein BG55_07345 [Erwinia mallotivora]